MISRIDLSIVTSPRQPFYLADTIQRLRETGFFEDSYNLPLTLIAGKKFQEASQSDLLNLYKNNPHFVIEESREKLPPSKLKFSTAVNAEVQRDLCVNHRLGIVASGGGAGSHVCILEDDVRVAKGWIPRLYKTIVDIEKFYGDMWVMTLFADETDEPLNQMRAGKTYYHYTKRPFWGTQAIVYPMKVAKAMVPVIMDRCVLDYQHPIDVLLGTWADEHKIPLLASAPSLVQHFGDVSTGVNRKKLVTQGFLEEIPT